MDTDGCRTGEGRRGQRHTLSSEEARTVGRTETATRVAKMVAIAGGVFVRSASATRKLTRRKHINTRSFTRTTRAEVHFGGSEDARIATLTTMFASRDKLSHKRILELRVVGIPEKTASCLGSKTGSTRRAAFCRRVRRARATPIVVCVDRATRRPRCRSATSSLSPAASRSSTPYDGVSAPAGSPPRRATRTATPPS